MFWSGRQQSRKHGARSGNEAFREARWESHVRPYGLHNKGRAGVALTTTRCAGRERGGDAEVRRPRPCAAWLFFADASPPSDTTTPFLLALAAALHLNAFMDMLASALPR